MSGAGASGLAAAVTAAGAGAKVCVAERMDKAGKKILATGNGKCNYTNRNISEACYRSGESGVYLRVCPQMPVGGYR